MGHVVAAHTTLCNQWCMCHATCGLINSVCMQLWRASQKKRRLSDSQLLSTELKDTGPQISDSQLLSTDLKETGPQIRTHFLHCMVLRSGAITQCIVAVVFCSHYLCLFPWPVLAMSILS